MSFTFMAESGFFFFSFFLIRVGVIILKCLKSHFGVKLYKRRDGCRGAEPAKLSTRAQIDSYVSVHDANQQGDEIMKPRMTGTCQTANSWSTDWWVWRKNWSDRESDWGRRCVQWTELNNRFIHPSVKSREMQSLYPLLPGNTITWSYGHND